MARHIARWRRWCTAMALTAPMVMATACGAAGNGSGGTDQKPTGERPALFATLPPEIQQSGVIRNGADFTYPPLEFVEADGTTFTGVDYELAQAVGEKLGVRIEHSNGAFGTLIPQLQSKRLDMVFSFATVTDERKQVVDFIEYSQSGSAMMVRKGNPDGIKTLADLCGKGVGLQSGAVQVPIADQASKDCVIAGKPPINVVPMGKDSEVQMLLRNGRIAVDLLDSPVAAYSAAQGDEFEVVRGQRYEVRPHGVMVLKGNDKLAEAIKSALDDVMADGTYKKILDKYNVPDLAIDKVQISRANG